MANFTITTPAAQDARITAAFGKILNLVDNATPPQPRVATGAEVKQAILAWLRLSVLEREQADARETAQATVNPINPT